jgi:thiamine pyrophosphokinase
MKAVLVAGGDPHPGDARWLDDAELIVAVDAGAAWLESLGRRPDALVGDLDSVEPALVSRLQAAGVAIERHPSQKDASDTGLALEYAVRCGADRVLIIGAIGGDRLDHELANVLVLAAARPAALRELSVMQGRTRIRAIHGGDELPIEAPPGALVSLLPVGGNAEGVVTIGLRYALDDEPLPLGSTRGLSNEVAAETASVRLRQGTLLVIETGSEGETE